VCAGKFDVRAHALITDDGNRRRKPGDRRKKTGGREQRVTVRAGGRIRRRLCVRALTAVDGKNKAQKSSGGSQEGGA